MKGEGGLWAAVRDTGRCDDGECCREAQIAQLRAKLLPRQVRTSSSHTPLARALEVSRLEVFTQHAVVGRRGRSV